MRLANRKHQDSPEGRLDHRDRQRVYRKKAPSPARDGSYFRPPPPIRQYQKTMEKTAKKAALLGGISASAAIEAVSSRHPARLHCVWAHARVIGPERERGRD